MVVGFGDNNCQIKHYYDFEADFDDFHKIISNCKFYLKKAATLLSRSIFGGADYEYIWITIIWRHTVFSRRHFRVYLARIFSPK